MTDILRQAIPTEPVGSIPRPPELIAAIMAHAAGRIDEAALNAACHRALVDTILRLEATGSPVLSDGEQRKVLNFFNYPVFGATNVDLEGFEIPFAAGHIRRLPVLRAGPFRYRRYADEFVEQARRLTSRPVKQAVIAPSALSLCYPESGIRNYTREQFLADLLDECETDIRRCFTAGAEVVQLDFTEGRLAVKLDPSGQLLTSFIELINLVLERFPDGTRARIGVHTCPGADRDSTHSADVDYADLLPALFELEVGRIYMALSREPAREDVLAMVAELMKPGQIVFVGVIDPIDPRIETAEEVCERVLEAARFIPVDRLGTTDDCGFAPFCDDVSTSRETAFAKIAARVAGTRMAARRLGLTAD